MAVARIPRCDLHTHFSFCDGDDTPEAFVTEALARKIQTLGFSAHAPVSFDPVHSLRREEVTAYRHELLRLQKVYGDRIEIFLGVEQDFYAEETGEPWDYIIGSVHYLCLDGQYVAIDQSKETLQKLVREQFGGNFYRLAEQYFSLVSGLPARTGCHIVGHFDLLAKFNADGSLFDEADPRYLRPAMDALDTLLAQNAVLEINSSDMCEGLRRLPYPAPLFLHRIAEKRGMVTLTSDAHRKEDLLRGFSDSLQIARAAGIGGVSVMTRAGWKFHSI